MRIYGLAWKLTFVSVEELIQAATPPTSRDLSEERRPLGRTPAAGVAVAGTLCAINAFTGLGGPAGLIIANSVAGAMSSHPQSAGAVSALVGTLHYGVGIAGSGLIAILSDGTPRPLGVAMALAGIGCFICSRTILPRGH